MFNCEICESSNTPCRLVFSDRLEFLKLNVTSDSGRIIMMVGINGKSKITLHNARRAAAKGTAALKDMGFDRIAVDCGSLVGGLPQKGSFCAVVEAILLSLYKPRKITNSREENDISIYLENVSAVPDADAQLAEAIRLVKSVELARDMVNAPDNYLYPETMAAQMRELAEKAGLDVDILDEERIKSEKMEAFLAVGGGCEKAPRLVVIRYNGAPESSERLALVGKGINYDTGGYSLKTASSLPGARGDMAGAAAVFGCMLALADSGFRINVTAVIPAAENRLRADGFVPGDVIGSMNGKTIQVINTDAEGRLILADAVTYAIRKEKATRVADIATLTGAVVRALGFTVAGTLCDDDELYESFESAAEAACEKYWRFPIFPEYEEMIKSDWADIKNSAGENCGTIAGGLFIREFAEGLPWLHIDIAGSAWTDPPIWEFQSKGATGAGLTTLYRLCQQLSEK